MVREKKLRRPREIAGLEVSPNRISAPEGWCWGTVEDFGAAQDNAIVDGPFGSNLRLSDYVHDGEFAVITITNIDEGFDLISLRKVSRSKFDEVERSAVRSGDILVAKIGSSYGKVGLYPDHMPVGIIPANLLKITPTPELSWKYL